MVLNEDFRLFHLPLNFEYFKQTVQTLIRRRVLWRLVGSALFANVPSVPVQVLPGFTDYLYQQHSDVTATREKRGYK